MILAANAAVGVITETNAEKALEVISFSLLMDFCCYHLNLMIAFLVMCSYLLQL